MVETRQSLSVLREQKEIIHQFSDFTKGYKPFKEFIKEIVDKDKKDKFREDTFLRLFFLVLDSGLRRDINDKFRGVPFLSRYGFFYFLKRAIGLYPPKKPDGNFFLNKEDFVILRFDLAGIGDLSEEEGDIRLNQAAQVLNNLQNELLLPKELKLYVGRYGGDEFVLSLVKPDNLSLGDFNEVKNHVIEFLLERLKQTGIELKNNALEEITLPQNPISREIFLAYLNRGVILSIEELEKEENQNNLTKNTIKTNIYGKDNPSLEEKIEYYKRFHPELSFPLWLAKMKDSRLNTHYTEEIIDLFEFFLVDSLLGTTVISRWDLSIHLMRGEFDQLFVFEIKIKEINDYFSFFDGDKLIKALWKKIKESVGTEENLSHFVVGRAGGIIFLGLKKNSNISQKELEEIISRFRKLDSIRIPGFNIDNFVGFYQSGFIDPSRVNDEIRKMFALVNDSWFELVSRYIESNFDKFKERVRDFFERNDTFKINDSIDLLVVYFFGKRKETRIRKLIEYLVGKEKYIKTMHFFQNYIF